MEIGMAVYFRDLLRNARESAQKDAENFHSMIVALEQLGRLLYTDSPKLHGLRKFQGRLLELARLSPLAIEIPSHHRSLHIECSVLYKLVTEGRNSEMHEGVSARVLTQHAIELSIIFEDALSQIQHMNERISDLMARNLVCAEMWHPISFIRQNMLANSFTYLPVQDEKKQWRLVSDMQIAAYLATDRDKRLQRLRTTLECAQQGGMTLPAAVQIDAASTRCAAIEQMKTSSTHVLLVRDTACNRLLGMVAASDLL